MKIQYWLILAIILLLTLFFLIYYEWIIIVLPFQVFEITNENYWILIQIMSDSTQYGPKTFFNQPNFIFTILNGLILGIYLNCLGLNSSMKKRNLIYSFLGIWIIFNMFGLIGFRITLNFPFLFYKSFTSNTAEGVLFIISNILYFTLIYLLSFMIESDIK